MEIGRRDLALQRWKGKGCAVIRKNGIDQQGFAITLDKKRSVTEPGDSPAFGGCFGDTGWIAFRKSGCVVGGFNDARLFTGGNPKFPAEDILESVIFMWPRITERGSHNEAGTNFAYFQMRVRIFLPWFRNFHHPFGLLALVRILIVHRNSNYNVMKTKGAVLAKAYC